jgi:hypothetical protein
MRDKINYGCVSSMYKILKSIWFKYRKNNDGRKFLMERGDIVAARIKFFSTVHSHRIAGDERFVFYLYETWVNQNHSKKYIWQDSSRKRSLRVPPGKERRLIVCHAGSAKTGFIPESKWTFRSGPQIRDSDYHSEMNADSFTDWFVNRFLNYLEEGSIIIMDNASYHSTIADKVSNTGSCKKDIQEWL